MTRPILGAAATPSGLGYYVFNGLGRVAGFGDAAFYGDLDALKLIHTITTVAPTVSGKGYHLLADDGSLYAFGDAKFLGNAQPGDPNGFYTGMLPTANGYRARHLSGPCPWLRRRCELRLPL